MSDDTTPAHEASPSTGDMADIERARLEDENAQLKDRLLRTLAEMDNLRKRTEREVADARAYAVTGFARDLLTVVDNFGRAVAAVPPEARGTGEAVLDSLIEGVELTGREFMKVLEKHGVRRIESEGARFDPNLHQAMFEVEDASVPAGTVKQVIQEGYVIGERVLRPALVGVAKGGPKEPRPVDPSASNASAGDASAQETAGAGATVDRTA